MSELLALRDAIVAKITLSLGAGWDVAGHLGRFGPAELRTFLTKAPAVRVAILGIGNPQAVDDVSGDWRVRIGIYVVAKDQAAKLSRDVVALAAVERIVKLAFLNRWGVAFAKPAEPSSAQNLYSDETVGAGVSMWAIDLPQPARLTTVEPDPADELDPLNELWIGFAPKIGAAHRDDYFGPFPPFPGDPEAFGG